MKGPRPIPFFGTMLTMMRKVGYTHIHFCIHFIHHVSEKKLGPFVVSSYICFDCYEFHENFQKYIGDVACSDSLTILCCYRYNETNENYIKQDLFEKSLLHLL